MNWDADILLWVNGHWSEGLDVFFWYISKASTWIPLYALLVGLIAYKYRNWHTVLIILIGFGVAVGLGVTVGFGVAVGLGVGVAVGLGCGVIFISFDTFVG